MAIKPVTVITDKVADFKKAVESLAGDELFIGVVAAKNLRKGAEDDDDEFFGNASIGYINEFGSPAQNIPARPHLRPGVEAVKAQIAEELEAGAKALLGGNAGAVRTSLDRAGIIGVNSVRNTITAGVGFAPLSIVTLLARKNKAVTGRAIKGAGELGSVVRGGMSKGPPDVSGVRNKPLIDTGQYRNAMTYVIRRKK